jgi:hypothetical protein
VLRPIIVRCVLAAVLSTASTALADTPNSGIEGQVFIGPTCPVVVEGSPCPDRPYQATITILDSRGVRVRRFQTDEQGRFEIPLEPGTYTLVPEPSDILVPHADPESVRVREASYTEVTISYDSGMR